MFFGCRASGEKNDIEIYNGRLAAIVPDLLAHCNKKEAAQMGSLF